ncbi:MFS transporter [Nocardia vermiculata]|uniref:MFS transporter n=1 Tax=Nocardia vermiculata TaxID=257274 RepID=A0A846XXI9_9NOCA|nr:MFS transporter [Nocardia vermiculata]NKY51886.1 MFS transporter [Nocardia vermiculata]
MDFSQGGMLAGYAIEGVLGQGGMGSVYRARHPRLPRVVAIKLLNHDVSGDPELRARFDREADIVARLDHPGIVSVHDRGVEGGQPWLAMQFVEGVDAGRLDPATMSVERAVRIVADIAAALDYAHSRGVLHRDVKPANILLTSAEAGRAERAVLTDFGIARLLTANTQLTSTGTFTATLAYASPEQLSGVPVDHRSDQYSLACTLFALLSGRAPFAATDPGQVVAGHLAMPVPPLPRPDVSPPLHAVIARAMAKNPAERFGSAGEFAAAALQAASAPAYAAPQPYPPMSPHPGWGAPAAPFGPAGWPAPPATGPLPNPWPATVAMAVGFLFALLVPLSISSALPSMMSGFAAHASDVAWFSEIGVLCMTVPLVVTGWLGERFGPRNIYLVGVGLFMLGSLVCVVAPGIHVAIAGTAVQGLGTALIIPQTMAVILRLLPPGRRGAALGLWGGCGAAAVLLARVVGAVLVDSFGWRPLFLLALPFGLIMIVSAAAMVPALPKLRPPADPVGVLLAGAGVLVLVWSLGRGVEQGWTICGPGAIVGLAVFALFLFLQARASGGTLLPKAALRDRNWWIASVLTLAATAALGIALTVLVLHREVVQGFAPTTTALLLVPGALVTAVLAPILGNAADRTPPAVFPAIGFVTAAAALVGLAVSMGAYDSPLLVVLFGMVLGVVSACLWGPLAALATDTVPAEHAGTGGGIYLTMRNVGSTIGAVVVNVALSSVSGVVVDGSGDGDLMAALRAAALTAAAVLLVCALTTAFLTRRNPVAAPPVPAYARQ